MSLDRSKNPLILTRPEFDAVGRSHLKRPMVVSRAWVNCMQAAEISIPMTREERRQRWQDRLAAITINFSELMETVRQMEQNKRQLLLGRVAWDIISDLNNEGLSATDDEYLIPWISHIHQNFYNGAARRARAAEHLREAYADLDAYTVSPAHEDISPIIT